MILKTGKKEKIGKFLSNVTNFRMKTEFSVTSGSRSQKQKEGKMVNGVQNLDKLYVMFEMCICFNYLELNSCFILLLAPLVFCKFCCLENEFKSC